MYFHFYGDTSLFIAGNLLLNLLSNFIWFYLCDYGFSYTLALRAMAIGANLSCVRFGTWIDHLITEETQTWATNITEKLNLMMRNSFVVIAKMIKNDFKWRGHVVPSDCNPVIWNFTRGWFITLTWPSIVDKHHGDNELSQCPPHWIRLDRTGYRQVRWAYFSIILNFFFLGASYEVISLEKIVQFSARDRERTNKIPLVSCCSTCPFRSKIVGAADLGGSEKIPRIECAFLGCYIFVSTCLHEVVPRWQKYTSLCVIWNFLRRKFCADSKPVKKKSR